MTFAPTLFLSHSGADAERAAALAARLREAGVNVCYDKDDLMPGSTPWQKQLANAIQGEVTAFAVLITSHGVVNWVEAEVSLAVSRAISRDEDFPVIPILANDAVGSRAVPAFARQFQTVRDVENDPDEWNKLLDAIKGGSTLRPEPEPFFGLQAIDADRSHLFFGRDDEIEAITEKIAHENILLLTGDSGSGKSSLLRAGLVRNWRGNAVGLHQGMRPGDCIWHVVTTHPGADPFRHLADAVERAAKDLGLSASDQQTYIRYIESRDENSVRRGLRCGLDPERTRTLLIIDQFEEILHPSIPQKTQKDFCNLIVALADRADRSVTVAMSMRTDYSNRIRNDPFKPLFERLEENDRAARYQLNALSEKGLKEIVEKPLRLARYDAGEAEALAALVSNEVGTRPGDLALIQFALTRAWDTRGQYDGSVLRAYAGVGRVEGALANEAERVYKILLSKHFTEQAVAIALIRLGSLSGAGPVRRIAHRHEFSDDGWEIVQFLASKDGNRLVLISGDEQLAEIAHEALLTQWGRLDAWLNAAPEDKRALEQLAAKVQEPDEPAVESRRKGLLNQLEDRFGLYVEQPSKVVSGADLARFTELEERHPEWLTADEGALVQTSQRYEADLAQRDQSQKKLLRGMLFGALYLTSVITIALIVLFFVWLDARASERLAQRNLSAALISLAEQSNDRGQHDNAAKLAIAALYPAIEKKSRMRIRNVLVSTPWNVAQISEILRGHEGGVNSVAFSPDGTRIVSGSADDTLRFWDAVTGAQIGSPLRGHEHAVTSVAFSPGGTRIVSGSYDGTLQLWDAATGAQIGEPLRGHEYGATSVAFSPDGTRIVSGWGDGTVSLSDAATGGPILALRSGHDSWVSSVAPSPDGTRIVSASNDGTLQLFDFSSFQTRELIKYACSRLEKHGTEDLENETGLQIGQVCTEDQIAAKLPIWGEN